MEFITENKTTNPPIITIVFIEFFILLPKTSPKFPISTRAGELPCCLKISMFIFVITFPKSKQKSYCNTS